MDERALGWSVHTAAGGAGVEGDDLAPGVHDLRRDRSGLGVRFLPLVSGQSAREQEHQCRRAENHRGEPAPGRLAYQRSLGKAAAIAAGLAALYSIFLPVLWVVLLHHVAADLSAGGAASEHR